MKKAKFRNPTEEEIVNQVVRSFRTMGGGRTSHGNPVAAALADRPPMFTTGVDVAEVVRFVLQISKVEIPVD